MAKEKTLRGRLAQLLCELSEAHAEPVNGNQYLIQSEITKVDIANFLSVANETIIRLMSDMKSEGLIGYQGKKILINDLDKLKSLSLIRSFRVKSTFDGLISPWIIPFELK